MHGTTVIGSQHDLHLLTSFQQSGFFELQHYSSFLESGIYLKFLDDLLRMVKSTPDQDKVATESNITSTSDDAGHTETEPVHCFTYNVDDPDSLWRQTPLLYVDTDLCVSSLMIVRTIYFCAVCDWGMWTPWASTALRSTPSQLRL